MNATKMNKTIWKTRLPLALMVLAALSLTATAYAAAPGITRTGATAASFSLTAQASSISQPDGAMIYSWGYGCAVAPPAAAFVPLMPGTTPSCPSMQVPGPSLIVTEGQTVTVTLTNNLPRSAGNTSILFPGFQVTATGGVAGLLTTEAVPGGSVTYTFTASSPGTRAYYSGTKGDLQVEMGLYGAIIVLPNAVPANCVGGASGTLNDQAKAANGESDFRLAKSAYDHPATCYDREYLFQFSEIDPAIHRQAEEQVNALAAACAVVPTPASCKLEVATEPYTPTYYLINGRSMPDDMDPNYTPHYPHQPYNGNPHMHPGELSLLRIIGQGRWQHPFHEHANHVRVLARDGNLILSGTPGSPAALAGPLLFTTTTTPGLAMDGIFYWTGKGVNWDVYGHGYSGDSSVCIPDANGYYTSNPAAPNYYEWCQDHGKALEAAPFGQVAGNGPVTLPDPTLFANGPWYGGSAYLGPDAVARSVGQTGTTPPSGTIANDPGSEAGFAYMWHSHNEREITTNNVFPGGMFMMLLIDPRGFPIDESK